jgi:P27 family predicted phage terminase small subunit
VKPEKTRPPTGLSPEAKRLWTAVAEEYDVDDAAGLRLLQTACEALDLMRRAEAQVKADGMVCRDRYGSIRGHPLLGTMRDARASMLAAFRDLHLDIEPPARGAGRTGRAS